MAAVIFLGSGLVNVLKRIDDEQNDYYSFTSEKDTFKVETIDCSTNELLDDFEFLYYICDLKNNNIRMTESIKEDKVIVCSAVGGNSSIYLPLLVNSLIKAGKEVHCIIQQPLLLDDEEFHETFEYVYHYLNNMTNNIDLIKARELIPANQDVSILDLYDFLDNSIYRLLMNKIEQIIN